MGFRERLVLFLCHYMATGPNYSVENILKFALDHVKGCSSAKKKLKVK